MGVFGGKIDDSAKVPSFDTFPAGNYRLEFTEGSVEATKKGDGTIFKHKIRVTSGEYEGRLIFGQFNLENPNPQAVAIGQGEFKAARAVTGTSEIADSDLEPEDLFFKEFEGVVKITPAKGEYEAKNAVNWGATFKLFNQGGQPEGGKTPVVANDNKPKQVVANNKPWPNKAAA